MPYRRLPNTDEQRTKALQAAKNKADSMGAAGTPIAFSADTLTKLNTFLPTWETEIGERQAALSTQAEASSGEDAQQAVATMYISHFIQVFNLGVARGKYSAADRAYYGLNVNQESVPPLTQESDVTLWGKNLIDGEAARTAAGGAPMQNPNITQVENEYNSWITLHTEQSNTKDAYDAEQEDVENLRPEADDLILDIWDEVEFTFRKEDPPSKRRNAREYGVVYVSRPGEEPEDGVLPTEG